MHFINCYKIISRSNCNSSLWWRLSSRHHLSKCQLHFKYVTCVFRIHNNNSQQFCFCGAICLSLKITLYILNIAKWSHSLWNVIICISCPVISQFAICWSVWTEAQILKTISEHNGKQIIVGHFRLGMFYGKSNCKLCG